MTAAARPRPAPLVATSLALHAAAVPAAALAPRFWPWIVGTLVTDHLAILGGGLAPRSALLGPNVVRSSAAAAMNGVVLTFDDGPDPAVTPKILDRLDAAGAKATFFVIGERARRFGELAAEIARRGHRLENHTEHHRGGFYFHRPATLRREIDACQEAVVRACGRAPVFFRAPAGIRSPLVGSALARSGLTLVSWTRRGFDTVDRRPERVAARLLRDLAAGDILVLHDTAAAPAVLETLPRLLDRIGGAGLRPVPLPDPS
ncbi:MAG TPA: polysaccharide deacetylase family protein [Candidatus Polarisedimenticolaceae bacterium]|nr:polysaccharide deacetylase family protein [Candidatus Polarisedimenticolaceae bacterium]